ncbi:MAG: galactokinase [Firmicutes bacterium]|nr:galactokinase [Bacillota bacterium]
MYNQEIIEKLGPAFAEAFGEGGAAEAAYYFAPGRANLIGEHIDYNGGHVLPCSLTMGTYAAVRKRPDRVIRFFSLNFPGDGVVCSSLDDLRPLEDHSWTAYIKGVIWALGNRGIELDCGMDMVICGDLPDGAGLSSSASLEVLAGFVIGDLFDLPLAERELAVCCQEAERGYVGVDCGIMDQFACAAGREGCAMVLDTVSLDCRYVPLDFPEIGLVITNTNRKHDLRTSAYNERRQQCAEALEVVRRCGEAPELAERCAEAPEVVRRCGEFQALCDVTPAEFAAMESAFDDPVLLRRARHAIRENGRVRQAAEALKNGQIEALGKLMNESHRSLKEDFEVSCRELDILAETAQELPYVLGSRMMGGGFGGCTISLVRKDALDEFKKTLREVYREQTGIECTFYEASPGGGPAKLTMR